MITILKNNNNHNGNNKHIINIIIHTGSYINNVSKLCSKFFGQTHTDICFLYTSFSGLGFFQEQRPEEKGGAFQVAFNWIY